MKGYLLLSDGTKFPGTVFGHTQNAIGEIVFNTGMTGYQEIVTDPSYFGQIVVLTYPLIGNYGISDKVNQSFKTQANGVVVRELATLHSNWESQGDFDSYLKKHNMVGISGVDTRYLTQLIRDNGNMVGQIVVEDNEQVDFSDYNNHQAALKVTRDEIVKMGEGKYHIGVMDFGIKENILNQLLLKDFRLTVYPATTSAERVLKDNPDGIFLSNGPGDPSELSDIIKEVEILSKAKPTFGICLGHQLLGHAYGCETEKLKFGHRGPNHPVKDIQLNRVFITSQNHSYMIDKTSIDSDVFEITHVNVNDESIEGFKHKTLPIFSVQYHPEASPGPDDSNYLFDNFEIMVKEALC
ncbi:carbamoyl phosphate synthase small subunit [Acidaminobacter sp. JC074]|uniref:carbamoyl phosphate synthase small subunit n=1 Tax=Acidaminobacter sp. JC074 TaxID=2530199 RepID=UPI001F1025BE|nr:carbamoyl phosphate synthase small subunit [Acidaminobacter sp. JC074]MCH4890347.1 carbamoyl phosphate synthase small subunit [Acidaminobacter sp. JC074]